jgi:hypothetical protein
MTNCYLRNATLALLVHLLLSSTGFIVVDAESACAGEDEYSKDLPGATLYYAKTATTFCARLEVQDTTAGWGWLALGISPLGSAGAMGGDGAVSVIGIVGSASVKKYDMYNWGVTEMITSKQTLTDVSIIKTNTKIIMQFDKPLVEVGEATVDDPANYFLFAKGRMNSGGTLGYHASRGSFKITDWPLSNKTASPTVYSTPAPTTTTTTAPTNNNTGPCVTDIANSWLQPKFCARTYKGGLQRPRGLHIDQETNEILMVERFGGYGVWDPRARVVRFDESESGR